MKKIVFVLLSVCLLGVFSGCGNSASQDSPITASVGGNDVICSDSSYADYMKENKDLVSVAEKAPVVIKVSGSAPDTITVEDALLDENGNVKKGEDAETTSTLPVKDGQCTFQLTQKLAAMTSSNSEDYGKGKCIRGFHITYKIDDNKYNSTFVIRTDI